MVYFLSADSYRPSQFQWAPGKGGSWIDDDMVGLCVVGGVILSVFDNRIQVSQELVVRISVRAGFLIKGRN